MKIFISWSGERSKYIAETLSNWLEQVLQVAEPWISTDIEKGKRWSNEISDKLKDSKVAIICLTNDNLSSKWIHFEAGAIAKTEDAFVCTFLFDVVPANVEQPLSQFQNTKYIKNDVLKLIKTINNKIGTTGGKSLKDNNLESVFNTFWPQLEDKLKRIPESSKQGEVIRTDREILEESLQLLRSIKNNKSTSPLDESDKIEILEFWIKRYADQHKIPCDSRALDNHEIKCANFISMLPEIKMIFGSEDKLAKKIKERIDELPPF
tara:strand:+ start:229 stop:1023 length:795 start_codon:yes stop_codon:yes gene_type:complete